MAKKKLQTGVRESSVRKDRKGRVWMSEEVCSQAQKGEIGNKDGLIQLLVAEKVPIKVDENGAVWVKKEFYDLLEGAKIEAEGEFYKLVEIPEDDMEVVFGLGAETPRCPPPF